MPLTHPTLHEPILTSDAATTNPSGVTISRVRISNFRPIKDAEIELNGLTLFIGANDAGKTSILDAIQVAIGAVRRPLGKEDIHLDDGETDIPKDRRAVIDILILPTDERGSVISRFPPGSFWTSLWGTGISQSDPDFNDQVIIRATLEWSPVYGGYRVSRHFLKEWKLRDEWLTAEEGDNVSATHIEPIALHYIDAKRDFDDDLRNRASFWRRLTDDLDLTDADITELEKALTSLNQMILEKSAVFKHIRNALFGLHHIVMSQNVGVDIAPVPRKLRDLSRGANITLSATGDQSFPIAQHGMGTRSIASLLIFSAFVSWQEKRATASSQVVHPMLALEEPEAHLHPQAQRAFFNQIKLISGQRLVSTHSPYLVAQSRLEDMRLVTKGPEGTHVTNLELSHLTKDDRQKLNRKVVTSRGDLLFARAIILFEGETEEQALPIFAAEKWSTSVHELGLSFVSVGGSNYYPFVLLAKQFQIPWYIFSDGEDEPVARLRSALKKADVVQTDGRRNVVIIPDGLDYEGMLIRDGYADAVEAAIRGNGEDNELCRYITRHSGINGKESGLARVNEGGKVKGTKGDILLGYMRVKTNKARLAAVIARQIVGLEDAGRRVPPLLSNFFDTIAHDLSGE